MEKICSFFCRRKPVLFLLFDPRTKIMLINFRHSFFVPSVDLGNSKVRKFSGCFLPFRPSGRRLPYLTEVFGSHMYGCLGERTTFIGFSIDQGLRNEGKKAWRGQASFSAFFYYYPGQEMGIFPFSYFFFLVCGFGEGNATAYWFPSLPFPIVVSFFFSWLMNSFDRYWFICVLFSPRSKNGKEGY